MKILLTGFEPFGRHKINPSEAVVGRLARTRIEGIDLSTAVLPVHREKAPEKLLRAFDDCQPDAVLMLGEAGGYPAPTIERYFINLLEYPAEWGGGVPAVNERIREEGPAGYFATFPVFQASEQVAKAGIPCRVSLSAGTYICNQVGYVMHDHIERKKMDTPAGFIHLPFLPEQAALSAPGIAWPSMDLDVLVRCVSIALGAVSGKIAELD